MVKAPEAHDLLKMAQPGTFLVRSRATNSDAIAAPFALGINYELAVLSFLNNSQLYKN